MATQAVPPLRVQKMSNSSSPSKTPFAQARPLSELSPMALRRNSPSFPRSNNKKSDSSPATASSPFGTSQNSPRLFWQGRDPNSPACENQNPSDLPSPSKRSSIENLKKASRVKNSSMFAREQKNNYDPSRPSILDGKPLGSPVQGNAFAATGLHDFHRHSLNLPRPASISKLDFEPQPSTSDSSPFNVVAPLSPSKATSSPTKSSLSKKTGANFRRSAFDPVTGIWEDEDDEPKKLPEGRRLQRHAKSVTFDQAPPQVNEYEMTTPDPSSVASGSREGSYDSFDDEDEGDLSYERGSSLGVDDSFDASLEDTEKTPVVLPEDWRFMSPENANTELAQHQEDVFDDSNDVGSPPPNAQPGLLQPRDHQISVTSVDSNGQPRPLPPLPPQISNLEQQSQQRASISGTLERLSGTYRNLPTPPRPAAISKDDLRRMSASGLPLEDRFRLMMIKDQDQAEQSSEVDSQRERRMRRAGSKDTSPIREQFMAAEPSQALDPAEQPSDLNRHTRRLSRDLISQQLRGHDDDESADDHTLSPAQMTFDPDVPIPSREDPTQHFSEDEGDDDDEDVVIKQEPLDDDELYAIPDMYRKTSSQMDTDDETSEYSQPSQYSQPSVVHDPAAEPAETVDPAATPRATSPALAPKQHQPTAERMSLPDFLDFGTDAGFDFGLSRYISHADEPPPAQPVQIVDTPIQPLPDLAALRSEIKRPFTPEHQLEPPRPAFAEEAQSVPNSPASVIRHSLAKSDSPLSDDYEDEDASEASGSIQPEPAEAISKDPSPVASNHGPSNDDIPTTSDVEAVEPPQGEITEGLVTGSRSGQRLSSLVRLDLPAEEAHDDLGLGLEREFDRVLESQKRGYLMRQNTKIVVATERASQDEQSGSMESATSGHLAVPQIEPNEVLMSPRKTSQPTWTAEPWNSKARRKSIRVGGESPSKRKPTDGPAPPLPGQLSNVDALNAVAEDELAEEEAEDLEDGAERGRLFVKVVGVKDLQLPFPQHERTSFALTLDNGLHCVTTAWLDLARNAPIGQEFELVVLNDLEFQLTLQMKLEEPKPQRAESPSKVPVSPKKQNAFGRLFGSPKKKKESDARQEFNTQRRPVTPPSAYELVQGLVAKDGSFARAYVSCSEYEKQAFGRPITVDIKCFNEWAMEEVAVGSSRSKKGVVQLQRRPPYEIGNLELQLLYVPKPKGAKDEDMPKSMNGAIRAMREAEEKSKQKIEVKEFEGFLSQQGGDCPFWRRRWFKLIGSKLTAYHETTRQPRATINLAKAAKLIDDKSSLTQKETSTKGGGRRKSAFADDEEGYMFVEEGFRIRFANGEVIDFYAENADAKEEWMKYLSQVIGKSTSSNAPTSSNKIWTDMVLKREKSSRAKKQPPIPTRAGSKELPKQPPVERQNQPTYGASGIPMPKSPAPAPRSHGHARTESYQNEPIPRANSPTKSSAARAERHRKTKSMFV